MIIYEVCNEVKLYEMAISAFASTRFNVREVPEPKAHDNEQARGTDRSRGPETLKYCRIIIGTSCWYEFTGTSKPKCDITIKHQK